MDLCKNCGAELTHIEGRRKKEFCTDNCRATFWQKNNKKKGKPENVSVSVKNLKKSVTATYRIELPDTAAKIQEYQSELLTLGDGALAKQRRKFLEKEIEKLKNKTV